MPHSELTAVPAEDPQSQAVSDVVAERQRQIASEGYSAAHDDDHRVGELAAAAACYSMSAVEDEYVDDIITRLWPWSKMAWKPKTLREDLVRGAALLIAEIERLDRAGA